MSKLNLTFAAQRYDRLAPIFDKRVTPEGIDLNTFPLAVEETFYRQARYGEFDVSEMSLSTYVLSLAAESPEFIAIPVFPSRYFRHQSMFVNSSKNIKTPKDLKGKVVGLPEYQITATVWQRGILQDDFGVRPSDISWRTGGIEQPGRIEKVHLDLPRDVEVRPIAADETLAQMLVAGEIDALICAHEPSVLRSAPNIKRLFTDYKKAEQDYFKATGIFPIMHVIVVRHHILDEHPWVAQSLYKAFEEARCIAMQELQYRSALMTMLPWLADHVEETIELMGADFWSYGLESNRKVLETFLRYSYEQGLANQLYEVEDLFAPSTLSSFVI